MTEARRTLRSWLLMAFLEKGCGATRELPPRRPARVRPVDEVELRQLAGPLAPIRILARDRRVPEPPRTAPEAKLLAFPGLGR